MSDTRKLALDVIEVGRNGLPLSRAVRLIDDHMQHVLAPYKALRRVEADRIGIAVDTDQPPAAAELLARQKDVLEWLVGLAYKHDEISVACGAELLGLDIVSFRELASARKWSE